MFNDYTKGESKCSRWLHGHSDRHHSDKATLITDRLNKNQITKKADLLYVLGRIKTDNGGGSFAKRVGFLAYNESQTDSARLPDDGDTLEGATELSLLEIYKK